MALITLLLFYCDGNFWGIFWAVGLPKQLHANYRREGAVEMGGRFPLRHNKQKSYALIMHSLAAQKPKREKAHLDTHRQGTGTGFCQELSACCMLHAAFFLSPRQRQARSTATIASPLATTNYNAIANARRLFISVSVCVAGEFMRVPSVSCIDIYLGLLPMQTRLVSHRCKLQLSQKPSHVPAPLRAGSVIVVFAIFPPIVFGATLSHFCLVSVVDRIQPGLLSI